MTTPGPLLFARYAYPPNALGYCGGEDHRALIEYVSAGASDAGLRQLARAFEGAWPYLQLIAGSNAITDPLDPRVVEAYWIGNDLLSRVDPSVFAAHVEDRFAHRMARAHSVLVEPIFAGAAPHHSYHVFAVYPWLGLLREGRTVEPLRVLESCRIRWGTVDEVDGGLAVVRSRPLAWNGRALTLGAPRPETVSVASDGLACVGDVRAGDLVSMHWDWICDRLSVHQASALRRHTVRSLNAVNATAPGAIAAAFG